MDTTTANESNTLQVITHDLGVDFTFPGVKFVRVSVPRSDSDAAQRKFASKVIATTKAFLAKAPQIVFVNDTEGGLTDVNAFITQWEQNIASFS